MKTLTLLRHAKSGAGDPAERDFDRTLNAKGQRAASAMGRHMRDAGLSFDHIVASPAVRVVETLEHAAMGYGETMAPEWDRRIYLASAATLLDVVRELPDSAGSVLLAGHNPGLEDLVLTLVPDRADDALRAIIEAKMPTGTLVEMTLPDDCWANVRAFTATIRRVVRPRDIDPSFGPDFD